jgi:Ca-activated chloride channel homolog
MYQLEEPKYFYLFIAIAILLVMYLLVSFWKLKKQNEFADLTLLNQLSPQKSKFKPILKIVVIALGLSFLILALVNPKMGTQLKTIKRQGVDIVFALDVSKSMLAEDIAPNRLEKAKQIIAKIIDKLGSDRVGIIIYAGNAYPLLPITTDHGAAKMFLQNASPDMVSSQGTAINEALKLAKTFYDDDTQTNRFLFIISDGEDHEENASLIAKEILDEGIKTFTIGVGSNKGAPIPIKRNGKLIGYKKDNKDEVVITKLNVETLKNIAKNGKGKYIYGNKTSKTIEYVEDLLLKADKKEFETKQFSDYKDQFQWFVGIGLLFLVIDVFLLNKKTKWIQKLNLFNEANTNKVR